MERQIMSRAIAMAVLIHIHMCLAA